MSVKEKQASQGNFYIKWETVQMLIKPRTNSNEIAVRNTEKWKIKSSSAV